MWYNMSMLDIAIVVVVIGLQSFWIARSLGRVETAVDALADRVLDLENDVRPPDPNAHS